MTIDNNSAGKTRALTSADINKITQEIYETEGAQAADIAFQRMAREFREAREAEPPDLEDWLVPADLEVGNGESDAAVIESLGELDLDAPDVAGDRARVIAAECLAAFPKAKIDQHPPKAEARKAEEGESSVDSPDDHLRDLDLEVGAAPDDKTGTDDSDAEALDWAGLEAVIAKAESSEVATPATASATEPVDFERPDPIAEHVGELDASAEAAVESAIARSEAYEDRPVETARTVEIRKYLAKLPKRGGARPAACEEFGIDPTDPLAVHKVKVACTLKTFKATLTDLEAFWPGYWGLPYRTRGKDDKGEPFPSRALVLKKFEWHRFNEITSAERKKLKGFERLKNREAKIVAKGVAGGLLRAVTRRPDKRTGPSLAAEEADPLSDPVPNVVFFGTQMRKKTTATRAQPNPTQALHRWSKSKSSTQPISTLGWHS